MATGNLTLHPYSLVTKVLYDKDKKKATGVEVLNTETNQTTEYKAKVIFLCASAFNSTWVLFNSATDIWPGGLGSSSGELGHNVMDHHFRLGANGAVDGFDDKYYFGRRPNGIYIHVIVTSLERSAITFVDSVTRVAPAVRDGAAMLLSSASASISKKCFPSPATGASVSLPLVRSCHTTRTRFSR